MQDFLNKIKNIKQVRDLFNKSRGVVGIDIGTSSIKVVQVGKKDNKLRLENYGELSLGPYANLPVGQVTNLTKVKLKEALTDIFNESKITIREGGLSIPLSLTFLSIIELPKVDKKKMDAMIVTEAKKYIPVPISEVMLNWWVLPKIDSVDNKTNNEVAESDTEGKNITTNNKDDIKLDETEVKKKGKTVEMVQVLIAAIHNDTIDKYMSIKKGVNLKSDMFEIDIFSGIRSVLAPEDDTMVVVDMGASNTKLAVVDEGALRIQHVVNMGSQDVTMVFSKTFDIDIDEAEKLKKDKGLTGEKNGQKLLDVGSMPLNYIFTQIDKIIKEYNINSGRVVKKIVLIGGGVLMKGFEDAAKQHFDINIKYGKPFDGIETPVFLKDKLDEIGPVFAVSVGLAVKVLNN